MKKRTMILLFIVGLLGIAYVVIINYRSLKDMMIAMRFFPSESVEKIQKKLDLTDAGRTIFLASQPEIESKSVFEENCGKAEGGVILGCYENQTIHLNQAELQDGDGLTETTLAHELLHAIWERQTISQKNDLTNYLQDFYDGASSDFKKTLEPYSSDEFFEELYVRTAVQEENIPDPLEEHYSKYFNNRKTIYGFYKESQKYEKHQGRLIY